MRDTVQPIPDTIQARLRKLMQLRQERKSLEEQVDEVKDKEKALELELHEYMSEEAVGSVKIKGLATFSPQVRVNGYVKDMAAFQKWCEAEGVADMYLQMKHRGKPLNELMKELAELGEEFPPGTDLKATPYISIRKA